VDLYLLPDLRERGAGLFLGHVPPGRDFTLNLYGAHRAVLDVQLDMDARPLLRLVHNRDAEAQWIELRRAHLEKELIPEDPPSVVFGSHSEYLENGAWGRRLQS
jgi:hypothetical protein